MEDRTRLKQLFQYVRALHDIRHQPPLRIDEGDLVARLGELPRHPSVHFTLPSFEDLASEAGDDESAEGSGLDRFTLSVARPTTIDPPSPPDSVRPWLRPGWDDVDGEVTVFDAIPSQNPDGADSDVTFDDDPQLRTAFASWKSRRDAWAERERPARRALALYLQLYTIYRDIERDAEQLELVLGDGILDWRTHVHQRGINGQSLASIRYPLLLQRLELSFDSAVPKFELTETDHPTIWNGALLRMLDDVPESALAEAKQEFDRRQSQLHPLDDSATSLFFSSIAHTLSQSGEFRKTPGPHNPSTLQIYRDPVIYHRRRGGEMEAALEAVLEDVEHREVIAPALTSIVGLSGENLIQQSDETKESEREAHSPLEILFTKPFNKEQVQIAERLDRYGCVIVQGPPGTGKTHTIANLIGHLLAHDKRVLVTSHTSKSLRVLREKVVDELQPLCVSLLDRDSESRAQLEGAIAEIVQRLSNGSVEDYRQQAQKLSRERAHVAAQLEEVRGKIEQQAANEYRPVIVGGEGINPSQAARRVAKGNRTNGWIPTPVTAGIALPLAISEIEALYHSNGVISGEDERELSSWLPSTDDLLAPDDFRELVSDGQQLSGTKLDRFSTLWSRSPNQGDTTGLKSLAESLQLVKTQIDAATPIQQTVMTAGLRGSTDRGPWEHLISAIRDASTLAAGAEEACAQFEIRLPDDLPLQDQISIIDDMLEHLNNGKRLRLLLHPVWRRYVSAARVNDQDPDTKAEFEALRAIATARDGREELKQRWQRQLGGIAPEIPLNFAATPEQYCRQFVSQISDGLDWHDRSWKPVLTQFKQLGFNWDQAESTAPIITDDFVELKRIAATIEAVAIPAVNDRQLVIRGAKIDQSLATLNAFLKDQRVGESEAQTVCRLELAIESRDSDRYEECWQQVDRLHRLRPAFQSRNELISALQSPAPSWADAIRDRIPPHDQTEPPGDVRLAWQFRQYADELNRRELASTTGLETQALELTRRLEQLTSQLVECRAWAAQIKRIDQEQRQALMGWQQTVKKIGKGTGKKAPRLRREARRLMSKCRPAVPVWIMPLSRLAESFNPLETMFDVVIVDEASQCDVKMLLAMYMAKAAVVVGDDEQVSPDAVGSSSDRELLLQTEFLSDIPNEHLYDGQLSIYALASQSFGGVIALCEHFRSVPEIIQFSNQLSYHGTIMPLRESGTFSPLISYRLDALPDDSPSSTHKINQPEVEAIAAFVQAIVENASYRDKTIGVISLLGTEQAIAIDRRLREVLPPSEIEARRIISGTPPHFQGDERDIILLSMVDRPKGDRDRLALREGGPHDMFKKRYNVAVSRARDQVWVMHSISPETDLKTGDIRKRLLDYVLDPAQWRVSDSDDDKVESEFERQVLERLRHAGYRVTTQWPVGHYRIDLVVEGSGKRLAVECDGERYHTIDRIPEDMDRQQILERLGWIFERVRGSVFFRNPDKAMGQVFSRLEQLGIAPEGSKQVSDGIVVTGDPVRDAVIRRAEAILRGSQPTDQLSARAIEPSSPEPHVDAPAPRPIKAAPMQMDHPRRAPKTPSKRPTTASSEVSSRSSRVATGTSPSSKSSEQLVSTPKGGGILPRSDLSSKLRGAISSRDNTEVSIGSMVTAKAEDEQSPITYLITESSTRPGRIHRISADSPLAKALIGNRQGDRVRVQTDKEIHYYTIIRVANPHTGHGKGGRIS